MGASERCVGDVLGVCPTAAATAFRHIQGEHVAPQTPAAVRTSVRVLVLLLAHLCANYNWGSICKRVVRAPTSLERVGAGMRYALHMHKLSAASWLFTTGGR